jgi:glutamyl-tRNA reductase
MKNFISIGLSYKKANTSIRSKYSFSMIHLENLVLEAKKIGIESFFIISTCNRTEIYLEHATNASLFIELYLKYINNSSRNEFDSFFTIKQGNEAIEHFFRVSAGIESQILGDFEIISQIKIWFKRFKKAGSISSNLERLINHAIEVSKKVKHETAISSGISSVSYAAIHYIKNNVLDLKNKNIVLFGLGKIGLNTCENLVKHIDNKQITVVNRTEEKSIEISKKFSISTQPVENFSRIINQCDVLIVATGADSYTVKKEMIRRENKPLLILDLSIPNNVEESVNSIAEVNLINVDALSAIINETLSKRQSDIPKAEAIIQEKLVEFDSWLSFREFAPFIQSFKEDLSGISLHLSKELHKKNRNLEGAKDELSEKLIQKLTNRFASYILENQNEAERTMEVMKKVFRIEAIEQKTHA